MEISYRKVISGNMLLITNVLKMYASFYQLTNVDLKGNGFLIILTKINLQNIQKIKNHFGSAQII